MNTALVLALEESRRSVKLRLAAAISVHDGRAAIEAQREIRILDQRIHEENAKAAQHAA